MPSRFVLAGLFACLVALVAGSPSAAKTDDGGMFVPGERWEYQSDLVLASAERAAAVVQVEHFAYLFPASDGREPVFAGPVRLWHLDPSDRYLRYRVSFEVPRVPAGQYRVGFCDTGCESILGQPGAGPRIHVVANRVERRLRTSLWQSTFLLRDALDGLRSEFESEVDGRDLRLRYQASRLLDLAQRVERLEERPLPDPDRGTVPSLWLVSIGFAAGVAVSALSALSIGVARRSRNGSLKSWRRESITKQHA